MLCDAMKELLKCLETVVNSELKNVYDRFNANRLTINKLLHQENKMLSSLGQDKKDF